MYRLLAIFAAIYWLVLWKTRPCTLLEHSPLFRLLIAGCTAPRPGSLHTSFFSIFLVLFHKIHAFQKAQVIFASFGSRRAIKAHNKIQACMTEEPISGTNFCECDSFGTVECRRAHEEFALGGLTSEAGRDGFLSHWVPSLQDFLENRISSSLIEFNVGPCYESCSALGMEVWKMEEYNSAPKAHFQHVINSFFRCSRANIFHGQFRQTLAALPNTFSMEIC
jgi:hypothetical protein